MKNMKIVMSLVVLVLVITVSAFTFHSKVNAKKPNTILYWYEVTYDAQHTNGIIQSSSDLYAHDDKANVVSPCDEGTTKDCLRGFTSELTSFPNTSPGMDQIKKP